MGRGSLGGGVPWATHQGDPESGRGTPRTAPLCPPGPATAPLSDLWAADFTVTNLIVSFTLVLLLCGAVALRLYLRHPRKLPAVLVSLGRPLPVPQPHGPGKPGAQSQPILPSARHHQEAPPGTLGGGRTDRSAQC